MRIFLMFEMILAVGAGLGLARWHFESKLVGILLTNSKRWEYNLAYVENLFVGAALVGMVGTWVESARASEPRPWRFGRMAWVMSGAYVVTTQLMYLVFAQIGYLRRGFSTLPLPRQFWGQVRNIQNNSGSMFLEALPWMFVAIAFACRLGRVGVDTRADARDWTGCVFAGLVVSAGMIRCYFTLS